jgi:hypothetical protein
LDNIEDPTMKKQADQWYFVDVPLADIGLPFFLDL